MPTAKPIGTKNESVKRLLADAVSGRDLLADPFKSVGWGRYRRAALLLKETFSGASSLVGINLPRPVGGVLANVLRQARPFLRGPCARLPKGQGGGEP